MMQNVPVKDTFWGECLILRLLGVCTSDTNEAEVPYRDFCIILDKLEFISHDDMGYINDCDAAPCNCIRI